MTTYAPAANDLTVVANVQSWMGLGSNVDSQVIQRLITAESTFIQKWLGWQIASQTYTEVRDGSGAGEGLYRMVFANQPVTAVTSLTIDDITIPSSTDGGVLQPGYAFSATEIWIAEAPSTTDAMWSNQYSFSRGRANVTIVYTAGYASTPLDIEQACIELVSLRYQERTRIGQVSKSLQGETVSFTQKALTDSIMSQLQSYRKVAPI